MDKAKVLLVSVCALFVVAACMRFALPYETAVSFIAPFGAGVGVLEAALMARGWSRKETLPIIAPLFIGSMLFCLLVPYRVDGTWTVLLTPLTPIGFATFALGGALFARKYAGMIK